MKRLCLILWLFCAGAVYLAAQEIVTLTTPQTTTATTCNIQVITVDLAGSRITGTLLLNSGKVQTVTYGPSGVIVDGVQGAGSPTGASLISTINKSNNSGGNTSLVTKVYTQLNASGICVGTVSGTPQ